jgi:hypothetical protein
LGDDICQNLILIGGKKGNAVARNFQALKHASLSFDLDDGVIFDKEKQVVLTCEYASGQERSISNVVLDYGLIVYTDNRSGEIDQDTSAGRHQRVWNTCCWEEKKCQEPFTVLAAISD